MRWGQISTLELTIEQLAPEIRELVNSTAKEQGTGSAAFWEGVDKEQFLAYAFTAVNTIYIEQRKRTAEAAVKAITESLEGVRNRQYLVTVVQKRKRFGIVGKLKETGREQKELTAFEINKILQARNPLEEILTKGEEYEQYNRDSQENQRVRKGYPNIRYNIREVLHYLPDLGMFRPPFSKEKDYKAYLMKELFEKSTGPSESPSSSWFSPSELLAKIFPADFLNLWRRTYSHPKQDLPFSYKGQGTAFEQLRELSPKLYEGIMPAETTTLKPVLRPTQSVH